MSATNTTTNYNLPIFIGSDKPAWLVDFNGAMNAIDAQMKVNADAIALKSPILTFDDTTDIDFTKAGNTVTAKLATGVSDKVGRALVTPIAAPAAEQLVAIDTNGAQAAMEIGSGLFNDSGTLKAVDLNLSEHIQFTTVRDVSGSPATQTYNMNCAFNSDRSIGKIYGTVAMTKTSAASYVISTGIYVPNDSGTEYDINPAGFCALTPSGGTADRISSAWITIAANGEIILKFSTAQGGTAIARFTPFIIFFSDFGDVE